MVRDKHFLAAVYFHFYTLVHSCHAYQHWHYTLKTILWVFSFFIDIVTSSYSLRPYFQVFSQIRIVVLSISNQELGRFIIWLLIFFSLLFYIFSLHFDLLIDSFSRCDWKFYKIFLAFDAMTWCTDLLIFIVVDIKTKSVHKIKSLFESKTQSRLLDIIW